MEKDRKVSNGQGRKGISRRGFIQLVGAGALATTLTTDYAQPADEEQIWSIWKGNARVRR